MHYRIVYHIENKISQKCTAPVQLIARHYNFRLSAFLLLHHFRRLCNAM